MIALDYDWIRLGLYLMCFASFNEARIDYNIAAQNNIFGQPTVKDAKVPASTFLLDRNQVNPSLMRDQLLRMQRHTPFSSFHKFSPFTYQHYNGIGGTNFPHRFNIYNHFGTQRKASDTVFASLPAAASKPSPKSKFQYKIVPKSKSADNTTRKVQEKLRFQVRPEPKSLVPKSKSAVNTNLNRHEKLRIQALANKVKSKPTSKPPKKLSRKIEPFFPSLPSPSSETKPKKIVDLPFQDRKLIQKHSGDNEIDNNLLPRFKIFQAVPL